MKTLFSPTYNYIFNPKNGTFIRWGATKDENPEYSPIGPEILDIEVSTICHGPNGPCKHCYKSNTPKGANMSLATFMDIFNKIPKTLTQIAFGIGDLDANKDLVEMFKYCKVNDYNPGVVPNITIHGGDLTDEWVTILATYCGGVAVSVYDNKNIAYDAVFKLTSAGIEQVNLHVLVSEQTLDRCSMVLDDILTDKRLEKVKAILFLTVKPKGVRNTLHAIKDTKSYKQLIDKAIANNITFGFDSCSAPFVIEALQNDPRFNTYATFVESCESNLFSAYINVEGIYWHCSFTEEHPYWNGINLADITDFKKEVWNHDEVRKFRNILLKQDGYILKDCRLCPVYSLYPDSIGDCSYKPDGVNHALNLKGIPRVKIKKLC